MIRVYLWVMVVLFLVAFGYELTQKPSNASAARGLLNAAMLAWTLYILRVIL